MPDSRKQGLIYFGDQPTIEQDNPLKAFTFEDIIKIIFKMVSTEQLTSFRENGYLIVRDLLTEPEIKSLQQWAQQVHDWEPTAESQFMPYEVRKRISNFATFTNEIRKSMPLAKEFFAVPRTLLTATLGSTTCFVVRSS